MKRHEKGRPYLLSLSLSLGLERRGRYNLPLFGCGDCALSYSTGSVVLHTLPRAGRLTNVLSLSHSLSSIFICQVSIFFPAIVFVDFCRINLIVIFIAQPEIHLQPFFHGFQVS